MREFSDDFEPERKAFLSRPKLDGLWVRLRYIDGETIEGVVPNDLPLGARQRHPDHPARSEFLH